jgi:hypothetical protein
MNIRLQFGGAVALGEMRPIPARQEHVAAQPASMFTIQQGVDRPRLGQPHIGYGLSSTAARSTPSLSLKSILSMCHGGNRGIAGDG